MNIKPYTGDVAAWARVVVDALMGRLTLRENAAAAAVLAVWNSDDELTLEAPSSLPRSIVLLRANLQEVPGQYVSGGAVEWQPMDDGRILITGIDSLTGGVPWDVELLLVED